MLNTKVIFCNPEAGGLFSAGRMEQRAWSKGQGVKSGMREVKNEGEYK